MYLVQQKSMEVKSLSHICLFATTWTIACQAPLEFSRQEYWSKLSFHAPGELPDPEIKPGYAALQADSLPSEPPGKPYFYNTIKSLPVSS